MRSAVITGASSGIGLALREYLGKEKDIYCVGGGRDFLDVRQYNAWEAFVRQCQFSGTKFDFLFLNAGVAALDQISELVRCTEIVSTNLLGVYYGLFFANLLMKKRGVVVVTASVSAYKTDTEMPLYGATKAGVVSLVRSFGLRYAGEFQVFSVSPGFVHPTHFGGGGSPPEELLAKIPVKRQMTTRELAEFMWALVEKGTYLQGSDIVIDGGWGLVT